MNRFKLAGVLAVASVMVIAAVAQTPAGSSSKPSALVTRGKYLVVNVGNCRDCHTPMDKKGQFIKGQDLQGAPLMFKPTVPVPGWMAVAPGIAGLNGWTDEQGIEFFSSGKKPDGSMAAPPMPAFRFNKADAAAVVAYLKSLK